MALLTTQLARIIAPARTSVRSTLPIAEHFPRAEKFALIADAAVDRLFGDRLVGELEQSGLRVERLICPTGEQSKTLETYAELVKGLSALGLGRRDVLLALGGGAVCDLVGFAAATYMRGIDWVAIPTTLLAMVDASIGGKTALDLPAGKNLVGAFWRPALVWRETSFLETLPEAEMRNGYAEMIKMAVLFDPALINLIRADLPRAIERCVELKERLVAEDFRDKGRRMLLNLGHTFGHAIEKVRNYTVPHGEAVAMGLRLVGRAVPEIARILDEFGFKPLSLTPEDRQRILEVVRDDKKRVGSRLTLVVPRALGDCELREVPLEKLGEWL